MTLLLAIIFIQVNVVLAQAPTRHAVTGKVTSPDGQGLPGVSIIIKGTTNGVASDVEGNYSIEAANTDVLVISYIGFVTQEVTVGTRTQINVSLQEDQKVLNEVVVTGYGELRKVDVPGAQTTISSKSIEKTVNTTVEQAIQGRAPGVYVTQNTGAPGGGISVNIRGVSSINGANEPLYVIDGVQILGSNNTSGSNPLATLNPADIESMEILQGPSATAIYGSRGTNGVVLVTTKRGKAGDVRINYGYLYSLQTEPKQLELMNLRQYAQLVGEYHELAGGTTPEEYLDPTILGEGTNWQDELFNNAPMNKHNLSLSGGSEKTTYYLSGEYLNQEGIALGSGFKRYSTRLNLDNKPKEWLSLGTNISFAQTNEQLVSGQENIISTAFQLPPNIPVTNLNGTWGAGNRTNNSAEQFTPANPIALASLVTNELTRRSLLGGINIGVTPIAGLEIRTSLNTNFGFSSSTNFVPQYELGSNLNPVASLSEGNSTSTYWNWNQLVQYTREFGKHHITAMASHESQESNYKNLSGSRRNFLVEEVIDLELGAAEGATAGGGQGTWAMESYLARVNYNFADRYIVQAAVRADGSVNFGPENRWGYFPSLSAAWKISEESFFNVPVINDLRLRYEIGLTGNQGGSGYIFGSLAPGTVNSEFGGTGFLAGRYANPRLQWEETKTNNFGLNLSLFENRVQFEADYYIKDTDNLLMDAPLPWYMGTEGTGAIGRPQVNLGALQNKGWSFAINTVNINKGNFKWDTNLNLSHFKTKVKALNTENAQFNRTSWWMDDWTQRTVVGQSPWLFYGYIEDGIFQDIADLENSALPANNNGEELLIAENSIWVGDVKYKDVNNDGIINGLDMTFIGNPWPKLFAGFTNTFSYKGLDLSVLITSTYGNDIYNYTRYVNSNPNNVNLGQNLLASAFDYAKVGYPEDDADRERPYLLNPGTTVARMAAQDENDNYNRHTSKYVEDGSFIRLKNVTLNYNLPATLLARQKFFKGARVGVSAQNIATITGYSGYDPEVGAYVGRDASTGNQAIGVDNGRYPLTPVYSVNVGVDF